MKRFLFRSCARFAVGASLLLVLSACTVPGGGPSASPATPSPAPGTTPAATATFDVPVAPEPAASTRPAGVCAQMEQLNSQGYPQRALALLGELDTRLPSAQAGLSCAEERTEALSRIAAAERLALAAGLMTPAPSPATRVSTAQPAARECVLLGSSSQGGAALPVGGDTILASALDCDQENAQALARNAAFTTTTSPTPFAVDLGERWSVFAGDSVAPLQEIALAFLLWLAVSIVVARLLPSLTRNRLLRPWMVASGGVSRTARLVGAALIVIGALVGTLPATPEGFIGGLVLTALGVLMYDLGQRSQLKLLVTVSGDGSEHAAANLRGIMADMGGAFPKGVEVPVGPDVDFLKDVDFSVVGANDVTNAVKAVLRLLKPHIPWQLTVEVVAGDRLAVALSRNGEPEASEIVDRVTLKLDEQNMKKLAEPDAKPTDPVLLPALWPFAAALVVNQIAKSQQKTDGLGGATNWRSIALHYIATTELKGRPLAEKVILGRAVDLDPGNTAAKLAFWYTRYRSANDVALLNEYRLLLRTALRVRLARTAEERERLEAVLRKETPEAARAYRLRDLPPTADPGLQLRAWYNYVVVLVNLAHKGEGRHEEIVDARSDLADRIAGIVGGRGPDALIELARTMDPRVEALRGSVDRLDRLDDHDYSPATPIEGGPWAFYQGACAEVPRPHHAFPPERRRRAAALLAVADLNDDLKAARGRDPQLQELATSDEYRRQFGAPVETDLLTIEPFATHAKVLRLAGLVDAASIRRNRIDRLEELGIPRAQARWLIVVALLATDVSHRKLAAWQVPITDCLVRHGIPKLGRAARHIEPDLRKELAALSSAPADLGRLWRR